MTKRKSLEGCWSSTSNGSSGPSSLPSLSKFLHRFALFDSNGSTRLLDPGKRVLFRVWLSSWSVL